MTRLLGGAEPRGNRPEACAHLGMFARLLDGLVTDADLGEDLLARSIVACVSEFSHGQIHHPYDLPVLLAGGGMPGNRHVHYDCRIDAPTTPQCDDPKYLESCNDASTNLWLTVLHALGSNAESFGESTGTLDQLW